MAREYNVIDADGHVLEPVDMFEKYMDPAYRDRAPRMIVDTDGKERLLVEGKILGGDHRHDDVADATLGGPGEELLLEAGAGQHEVEGHPRGPMHQGQDPRRLDEPLSIRDP